MKKLTLLALAATAVLAVAGTAQAKEIASLKVCGASGCNTVTDRDQLKGWEGDGSAYPESVTAPGAQRFYTLELGFGEPGGNGNIIHTERAFWLPDGNLFRFKSTTDPSWWTTSARQTSMYQGAAAGLEAYTPKIAKVTVAGKRAADPNSYMRLFDKFPYVSLPKGKLHLISIVLTPDGVNPFMPYNGKTTLRYDAKRHLLVRADGYFRISPTLGKLVMSRSSLKAKASTSGSGDGGTALYAGLGVGVLAALAVLVVARHKKMT